MIEDFIKNTDYADLARKVGTILIERIHDGVASGIYFDPIQVEKINDEEAMVICIYRTEESDWWKRAEFRIAEGGPDGFYVKGALKVIVMGENGEVE